MTRWVRRQGHGVNRKRIQGLMGVLGLEAIYRKPSLLRANAAHRVYPYLQRGPIVDRPNQVWATDITYVPVQGGCAYLCAVIDWHSRYVLAWELSNTLEAAFCVRAIERAIAEHGVPEIFNTDQGCQFTSTEFTKVLLEKGVQLSMDGKGRGLDNVLMERLWRTVKYEEIYLKSYQSLVDAHAQLNTYIHFYNEQWPHSSHNDATPRRNLSHTVARRRQPMNNTPSLIRRLAAPCGKLLLLSSRASNRPVLNTKP